MPFYFSKLPIAAGLLVFAASVQIPASAGASDVSDAIKAPPTEAANRREINTASLMLEQGHPDIACRILHTTTPADSADAERLYLLARCSADLKQNPAAIAYYRKVIELLPQAPRPRTELAALYVATGQVAAAQKMFADTANLDPNSEISPLLQNVANRLGANDPAILAELRRNKKWSIELFAGVTYDDNINGGPSSTLVPAVIGGTPVDLQLSSDALSRASFGVTGSIAGTYVEPLNEDFSLLFQGALSGTGYFADSSFNNDSTTLAAALLYRHQDISASIQPNVRYTQQGGVLQEATPDIVGRISKNLTPTLVATGSAGYFDQRIPVDSTRDAKGHHASLGMYKQFTDSLQIGGEYFWQRENASADIYSRRLYGPSVFATYKATQNLTLIGNYRYASIDYDQAMAIFPEARKDRQQVLTLTGLWDISRWAGRNLAVRAQYLYTDNPSNIAFDQYSRNIFILGLQTQF
jgi:tetratricopeptide (TPR) repeat protein